MSKSIIRIINESLNDKSDSNKDAYDYVFEISNKIIKYIDENSTSDVISVVRCKDCSYCSDWGDLVNT